MNLNDIHHALKAKNWVLCAGYTGLALKENNVVVRWDLQLKCDVNYAEWQAGASPSFKVGERGTVSYRITTVPTPAVRVGNSWSGGIVSTVQEGSCVSVTSKDIEHFMNAMKKLCL